METLRHYRREGHYKLRAFVVMPDRLHLILTPQKITPERAVGMIKGGGAPDACHRACDG
jgi:REP-associated tyrosine transposase